MNREIERLREELLWMLLRKPPAKGLNNIRYMQDNQYLGRNSKRVSLDSNAGCFATRHMLRDFSLHVCVCVRWGGGREAREWRDRRE
jgi:hypothetical protein